MVTPTTFRADIAAGIEAVLNAFKTTHPDLLLAVYRARPESLPDLPAAFIDSRPETITHDSGTRTRTMAPSVVVVRRLTNNAEAMATFDTLVDLMVDAFTASPQFTSNTIWSAMTVADEEYDYGGEYLLAAVRFSFGNVSIMEGRV
jgi:hypothetical protein